MGLLAKQAGGRETCILIQTSTAKAPKRGADIQAKGQGESKVEVQDYVEVETDEDLEVPPQVIPLSASKVGESSRYTQHSDNSRGVDEKFLHRMAAVHVPKPVHYEEKGVVEADQLDMRDDSDTDLDATVRKKEIAQRPRKRRLTVIREEDENREKIRRELIWSMKKQWRCQRSRVAKKGVAGQKKRLVSKRGRKGCEGRKVKDSRSSRASRPWKTKMWRNRSRVSHLPTLHIS
jgi:hypothetical protein